MSELKPCPFCGGEPERRKILGVHHIACKSCGSASSGDKYLPGTEHTWNNRPAPKLPEDTERHQVQMAGISCAAFGYAGDCKKGDYGWSVALDDVKELYRKYSECREQAQSRPAPELPELPEGYRVDEDGDLWTDEEVMPTALAYMKDDGSLSFNFTNYNASESAALIIWLQRRAR